MASDLTFGEMLFRARRAKGHSQEQAAFHIGVHLNAWHRWERDRVLPRAQLNVLSGYMGVSPSELRRLIRVMRTRKGDPK